MVHAGDIVTVDVDAQTLNLEVEQGELDKRRAQWVPPAPAKGGLLAKYQKLVSSAHYGAVTR